jgi:hypothetical protein
MLVIGPSIAIVGCAHPERPRLETFLASDADYLALPVGTQRIDAIWAFAVDAAGSERDALDLLGTISAIEGLKLQHPFNTGLTAAGVLAPNDKTGHFFAHAMWQYNDHRRLIPVAGINGIAWEVVGEIKSWFTSGAGYDFEDIWANRLGREFGRRLYAHHVNGEPPVLPSGIIQDRERFRPKRLMASSLPLPESTQHGE